MNSIKCSTQVGYSKKYLNIYIYIYASFRCPKTGFMGYTNVPKVSRQVKDAEGQTLERNQEVFFHKDNYSRKPYIPRSLVVHLS